MTRLLIAAGVTVLLAAWPASASAFLAADATTPGHVRLVYFAPKGTTVDFFERAGDARIPLGSARSEHFDAVVLEGAARWRCDRLVRDFEAVAGDGTTGSFSVRTPSCRERLALRAPRRVRRGASVRLRVVDTWRLERQQAALCIDPPRGRTRCHRADSGTARRFRARVRGHWRLRLVYAEHVQVRELAVGVAPRRLAPLVRTTGDSTIQGIEAYLADDLGRRARVDRDFHVGTGISRPTSDWPGIARRQARRPARVTVISVGATDLYPMTTPAGAEVRCCEEPWIAEYARRAGEMIDTYTRRGRRVLWLALPAPRDEEYARAAAAVNLAVGRAVARDAGARHLRIDEVLSPGGVFSPTITHEGREVRVRERDGIHLTAAGTRIAAEMAAAVLRDWL